LCQSLQDDAQRYRQTAEQVRSQAVGMNASDFLSKVKQLPETGGSGLLEVLKPIAENPKYKYSRLFAIGIYTLLEIMSPDLVKDEKQRNEALEALAAGLQLSADKMQKDLELYRSNLEKLSQARQVMEDILQADRKKKEERQKAKDAIATPPSPSSESA
jgi:photosystem II biogenesis protein Psp29